MSMLILSHKTALEFWKIWATRNGISLRLFHSRRATQTDDLPFRVFPSVSVLSDAATTKGEIFDIVYRALAAEPSDEVVALFESCGICRSKKHQAKHVVNVPCTDGQACRSATLHVLGPRKPGMHNVAGVSYHHSSSAYPKGSFLKIAQGVYVCSPELVFAQMAASLSFGALLALGYELCGCYPVEASGSLVRHPLCSPNRLIAFVGRLHGFKGIAVARKAARYVLGKSASPAETSLAIIVTAPRNYGGFGVRGARLNEPVKLSRGPERIAHSSVLVCDMLWPNDGVALEYDSTRYHEGTSRLSRDSRRRSALAAQGLKVRSITADQFENVFEFQETILHVFRESGKSLKRLSAEQLDRHMKLRGELHKEGSTRQEQLRIAKCFDGQCLARVEWPAC